MTTARYIFETGGGIRQGDLAAHSPNLEGYIAAWIKANPDACQGAKLEEAQNRAVPQGDTLEHGVA